MSDEFQYRIVYDDSGGAHVRARLYTAPRVGATFARNGDLIFRREEFEEFRARLGAAAEFVPRRLL